MPVPVTNRFLLIADLHLVSQFFQQCHIRFGGDARGRQHVARDRRVLFPRNLAKSGEVAVRFLVLHCRLNFRVLNLNARLNGIYVKLAFSIIPFGCFY